MIDASEIYAFIKNRGRPCRLPEPWHLFPAHEDCFHPQTCHADQLAELQGSFSREALVKAGVIVLDAQGRHALSPMLSNPDSIVLAVRKSLAAPPFALVSDIEIANETSWAFTAVLGDCRAKSLLEKFESRLFIVESMADAAVLWAMGFPAAPAQGLANLSRQRISEFCSALGLVRPNAAGAAPSPHAPRGLLLLPWSPARLDAAEIPRFAAIRQHLGEIRRHLRIPLENFGFWKPRDVELQRLKFCVERGAAEDIRHALLDSYQHSAAQLFDPRPARPVAKSFAKCLRAWLADSRGPCDPSRRQQAWERLLESLDCELIQPLLQPVATGAEPATQLLRAQAAVLGRLVLPQLFALDARSPPSLRERSATAIQVLPKEEVQQVISLVDRFLAIHRELRGRNNNETASEA